jgi:hypothetical protein
MRTASTALGGQGSDALADTGGRRGVQAIPRGTKYQGGGDTHLFHEYSEGRSGDALAQARHHAARNNHVPIPREGGEGQGRRRKIPRGEKKVRGGRGDTERGDCVRWVWGQALRPRVRRVQGACATRRRVGGMEAGGVGSALAHFLPPTQPPEGGRGCLGGEGRESGGWHAGRQWRGARAQLLGGRRVYGPLHALHVEGLCLCGGAMAAPRSLRVCSVRRYDRWGRGKWTAGRWLRRGMGCAEAGGRVPRTSCLLDAMVGEGKWNAGRWSRSCSGLRQRNGRV